MSDQEKMKKLAEKEKHINDLKLRVKELKGLISEHAIVLDAIPKSSPTEIAKKIEQLRLDRINTLQRTRMEPEDY